MSYSIIDHISKLPFLVVLICVLASCRSNSDPVEYSEFMGKTMGTTYSIKSDVPSDNAQVKVDSLLLAFDKIFSTYNPNSIITEFNSSKELIHCFNDINNEFLSILNLSKEVFKGTQEHFDPTVMPMVNYWGFGPKKKTIHTSSKSQIDSIRNFVGFDKLSWVEEDDKLCITKGHPQLELDLNAIAKGKGVDLVAALIEDLGAQNYMVEIGGEVVAKGVNGFKQNWKVAIDRPISSQDLKQRRPQAIIQLKDKAMASSGNYRNFYRENGKLVGHTMNPIVGYPEMNSLLAVSVVTDNCAKADAYATGFMALGKERSFEIAKSRNDIAAYFIFLDTLDNSIKTIHTGNMESILQEVIISEE